MSAMLAAKHAHRARGVGERMHEFLELKANAQKVAA